MSDFAHGPDTIVLGDLEVRRLGFGAMRLPGPEVWGEPANPERAKAVLRRVVELGMTLIDTAWYYGPDVSNRLIAETLRPYPSDLVIATKLGGRRHPDKSWGPFLKPAELREGLETDLRQLHLERIDVVHLRFMPIAGVPFLEALGALRDEQKRGRIRHIALSNVGTKEILAALGGGPIVAVQNAYNVGGGSGEIIRRTHAEVHDPDAVLELCTKRGIAYLPFFPLAVGQHERVRPALATIAKTHGATPAQIALAWLLARSPVMLPIPGTSSPEHLEENWAARKIQLTPAEVQSLASP